MKTVRLWFLLVASCFVMSGCGVVSREGQSGMYQTYQVTRAQEPMEIDGDWNGQFWANVAVIDIRNVIAVELHGKIYDNPEHQPKTQAKLAYDDSFIYVIFRVEDNYVRAVAQKHQGKIWEDSCAEFFFAPGKDISGGYFNVETNCGGTMLFHYQIKPWENIVEISKTDMKTIEIFHSEPKIVDPEKQEPTTWVIEYRIPLDILEKHRKVDRPGPGAIWKANFYKCADKTSHPHWLAWSGIEHESPSFHLPEFFGTLQFK